MIEGLVLVVAGVGLIVAMVAALGSSRVRARLYRGSSSLRSSVRLQPTTQEVFARRFEMGIYAGMCFGAMLAILGVLVAFG